MANSTNFFESDPFDPDTHSEDPWLIGLVLLWSFEEPWRVGESLVLPDIAARKARLFGRDAADGDPDLLKPFRIRPHAALEQPLLKASRISRRQLELLPTGRGALRMTSVGRAEVRVNGQTIVEATLAPGDVLEIKSQLVFLVVSRPQPSPGSPLPEVFTGFPFGEADGRGIVGESEATWALRSEIAFAAQAGSHVLIQGESGAGKEGVAGAVHALSKQGEQKMVSRNVVTIPEGLMESELFGSTANYPSSGMPAREGLLGRADGSTLFLDEIGELPEALQARLLRVMDEGEYHQLGEAEARQADVRFITATNRPTGHLKHDILARLSLRIEVPSLRDRREDTVLIARHLLKGLRDQGLPDVGRFFPPHLRGEAYLSPALAIALTRASMPGNVRDIQMHLLEAIRSSPKAFLAPGPALLAAMERPVGGNEPEPSDDGGPTSLGKVKKSLRRTGSLKESARELGLTYRQLVHILEHHSLNLKKVLKAPE